jgi:3-hydroxybutyryl-CoA dehydrogenase
LAALTACAGFHVVLEDVLPSNLRRAEAGIRDHLMEAAKAAKGNRPNVAAAADLHAGVDIDAMLERITFVSTVEDAVRQADLALDCVPDELESKLEIFSMLDRMAPPRTILCTPTNTVSIADIASCTYRADRCLAVRPVLAENIEGRDAAGKYALATTEQVCLVYSHWTLPSVLEAVTAFWEALGKTVTVEYDGSFAPSDNVISAENP